jgi:HEAT repeats
VPLIRRNHQVEAPDQVPAKSELDLLAELASPSAELRRLAAIDLGARDVRTSELAAHLADEPDRAVREAIGSALLRASSRQAAMAVAPLLSSDDATLRNEVRELLHLLPNAEEAVEVLLAAADPDVRMFALEVLASRCRQDAAPRIAALLATECDVNVVAHGVEQLGAIGTDAQLVLLENLCRRFSSEEFLLFTVAEVRAAIEARSSGTFNF